MLPVVVVEEETHKAFYIVVVTANLEQQFLLHYVDKVLDHQLDFCFDNS